MSEKIKVVELNEDIRGDKVTADLQGAYKSVYFNDTKEMGEALNKVSPSFCLAKWFNVSVHIPTGSRFCQVASGSPLSSHGLSLLSDRLRGSVVVQICLDVRNFDAHHFFARGLDHCDT